VASDDVPGRLHSSTNNRGEQTKNAAKSLQEMWTKRIFYSLELTGLKFEFGEPEIHVNPKCMQGRGGNTVKS
jgi:hypothetical protein